jgi:hypothetical protein
MFIAPHSASGNNAAHSHIGPWEWAALLFQRRSFQKNIPCQTNFSGIPNNGDAGLAPQPYPCVNLGNKGPASGCSLRPTRHPGQTPLIPISDDGNGRLIFSGAHFFENNCGIPQMGDAAAA